LKKIIYGVIFCTEIWTLLKKRRHSWTYQSLIHDVLETGLNSVAVQSEGKKKQFYDLGAADEFWMTHRFSPALPDVAEAIHRATEDCQAQENQVKSLKVSTGESATQQNIENFGTIFLKRIFLTQINFPKKSNFHEKFPKQSDFQEIFRVKKFWVKK